MNKAENLKKAEQATRKAFSSRIAERAEIDTNFVVFESDIGHSTYTNMFGEKYPERYLNMGITE